MKHLLEQDWVATAECWQLKAERMACEKRIDDLWTDPDLSLSRNRYDIHDANINLIRRIDARLAELDSMVAA